jgi:predicted enzyme related to lactoylglutathione lyase
MVVNLVSVPKKRKKSQIQLFLPHRVIHITMKRRVTGLGGVFFKARDPEAVKAWYEKHLQIEKGEYGTLFKWRTDEDPEVKGATAWNAFPAETDYFQPSEKSYMFNYRVENLEELLKVLEEEGVEIVGEMEVYSYGKFGWIMDPEGNKIELWEPLDEESL